MSTLAKKIILIAAVLLIVAAAFFYFAGRKGHTVTLQNVDILITNAQVVTMDANSDVYNPGWIAIAGGKIVALGSGSVPKQYIAGKTIDAQGQVAMPGLVNTHSHAAMTLFTGIGQGEDLQPWLNTMSDMESGLTSDDVYWGTMLAADKMIKSGTTTFNDMYYFSDQAARAATEAGMRAVVRIPTTMNGTQIGFDNSIAVANENNPLISFSLAPNPLLDYTPDQLKQISDYALAHNYIVHIHFEEDAQARTDALAKYNLTPMQLITQAGLLRNKIVLAHDVDTTAAEISGLGQYPNAGVSFNPLSEYNLHTPLTPAPALLNAGVTVAFGTDGEPSSNLDMFAQINFAANGYLNCSSGQKFCQNGKTIDPEEIIRMATINGAEILGLDSEIGSLESGKQADIILVSVKPGGDVYPDTFNNTTASCCNKNCSTDSQSRCNIQGEGAGVYSNLVYNTSGKDVTDSIIDGKLVLENGKLLTINEAQVLQETQAISAGLKNQPAPTE